MNCSNSLYVIILFHTPRSSFGPQQTVHVERESMLTLTQGSLRDVEGVQALEEAATQLYKALQAGRDGGEFRGSLLLCQVVRTIF